jgi:histidinol phosphatase-like PHP family hydrolase
MIDLHTHTLFSDGVLIPSELVYRAKQAGYTALAITDHADYSNYDFIIPRIIEAAKILSIHYEIKVVPGVEITYVPPTLIYDFVKLVKALGAKLIVVHGETAAETVPKGTNLAAVKSGVHILAHPGFLSDEEAKLAAKNNVRIEITTRASHGKTNAQVAATALAYGAKMVLNTDTHTPDNFLTKDLIKNTLKLSGLDDIYFETMQNNSLELLHEIGVR